MVAVITGNGLGIGNSSLTQIGQGPVDRRVWDRTRSTSTSMRPTAT